MNDQSPKNINKNETLPPVRIGELTNAKLTAMCTQSGKSKSNVIRDLIDNGKVEVILNGKDLIKDVANLHNRINHYSLKISNDIQAIKQDIQNVQKQGVESNMLRLYLATAMFRLDDIQRQYNEQKTIWNQILDSRKG